MAGLLLALACACSDGADGNGAAGVEAVLAHVEASRMRGHVDPEADAKLFLAGTAGIFAFALAHPGPIPPPFPGAEP